MTQKYSGIQGYRDTGHWVHGFRDKGCMYTAIQRYNDVAEIRDKGLTHIIILIRRYADKRI